MGDTVGVIVAESSDAVAILATGLPGGILAVLQEVRGVHVLLVVGDKLSVPSLKGDGGDTGGG